MERTQIKNLISAAVEAKPQVWADLGSGEGAFTLALRELAGPEIEIYSVDKKEPDLLNQLQLMQKEFPGTNIHLVRQDFTDALNFPPLDGVLMANSLHFVENKSKLLRNCRKLLKPEGKILVVEYTASPNPWVPYPISFEELSKLTIDLGIGEAKFLARAPSKYQKEIYSALIN